MPRHSRDRCLDFRVPLPGRFAVRLVARLGCASAGVRAAIVRDLRYVADACLPGRSLRYGVLGGDPDRLDAAIIAILYARRSGRPLGFSAATRIEARLEGRAVPVLHVGLCMMVPGLRRTGLSVLVCNLPAIVAFAQNRFLPLWVTSVSQVPAAVGMFANGAYRVFPAPGVVGPPSSEHRAIARTLFERHRDVYGTGSDAEFDEDAFIIRNAYTGGSDELRKRWLDAQKHRDEAVNEMCRTRLDYDRGDDFLQVGTLTLRLAGRALGRFISRWWRRPVSRSVRGGADRRVVLRMSGEPRPC